MIPKVMQSNRLSVVTTSLLLVLVGILISHTASASRGPTACGPQLTAIEGLWNLRSGTNCPRKLEMSCEADSESRYPHVFVDEISGDETLGAQIYFAQVGGPAISLPNDLTVDEKEVAQYNDKKQVLTSSYKKCKLVLGCWGTYKVRHQIRFTTKGNAQQAVMERMWGESKACVYNR